MPILIDVRTINDHFPGIARYGYQLVRAIARRQERDEIMLVLNPGPPGRFDLAPLASRPGINIVPTQARPFSVREQLLLPRELRRLHPSVSHFPYPVMPCLAPRPFVLTVHDVIPARLPHFFTRRKRILYRASMSLALRAASVVICISQATLADLKTTFRVEANRILVIPEGVDGSFSPRPKAETDAVRALYRLPESYILYVGSNKPHKNLPALVEACSRARLKTTLVIAGIEDPRYPETRRAVERWQMQRRVLFLGQVKEEELPALYSGAEAFVFPSLYEGFGLPPLEAMACGVPVACSDIPSLRETAGDAACYFDPASIESMAGALARLVTDRQAREEFRWRGLRRAAELTWDAAAQRTVEAYRLAAQLRGGIP